MDKKPTQILGQLSNLARIFLLSFTLASCSSISNLVSLQNNLVEMEQTLSVVAGRVIDPTDKALQGNIIVVLLKGEASLTSEENLLSYKVLRNADESFVFVREELDTRLIAFKDVNGDFRYQPDEPIHVMETPPILSPNSLDESQWRMNTLLLSNNSAAASEVSIDVTSETVKSKLKYLQNVGRVTDFSNPNFSTSTVEMGLWSPLAFAKQVGYGFYLLEPWQEDKDVLLLIHGINDSPRSFRDLLPQLNLSQYQPVFFHYPSGLDLETSATVLSEIMSEFNLRMPNKKVRIVAHSMGGLIARRYVQLQQDLGVGSETIEHLLTISTPWGGHKAAEMGVKRSPVVAPVWRDMVPSSDFISGLHNRPLPAGLQFSLLFSYSGQKMLQTEAGDGTVTLESQLDYRAQDVADHLHGLNEGHVSILSSERTAAYINQYLLSKGVSPYSRYICCTLD